MFNIFWQTYIGKTLLKIHCHTLKMSCAIYVPQIPFKRQKTIFRWVQKWVAPSMSLKSQSNLRTNSLQYLENEPLNVLKLIVDRILWIEMIKISLFNIFWQKYIEKDFYSCIARPWKWVAPSMSLKPHSNTRFFFPMGSKMNCTIYVP